MTGAHQAFRALPPTEAPERDMLADWLAFQRATLARACAGLSDRQLRAPMTTSSNLSLFGIVRHMVGVEGTWFRAPSGPSEVFSSGTSGTSYVSPYDAIAHLDSVSALATWRATCRLATEVEAGIPALETLGAPRSGPPHSLRWIMMYLIQEYARHNGHADLIREHIDGRRAG
jgi:uncharacterized damage-inducible protein DinB